jgi:hypothetical protein
MKTSVLLFCLALAGCAEIPKGSLMPEGPAVSAPRGCADYLRRHPEADRC